jgi:hypothetical protein
MANANGTKSIEIDSLESAIAAFDLEAAKELVIGMMQHFPNIDPYYTTKQDKDDPALAPICGAVFGWSYTGCFCGMATCDTKGNTIEIIPALASTMGAELMIFARRVRTACPQLTRYDVEILSKVQNMCREEIPYEEEYKTKHDVPPCIFDVMVVGDDGKACSVESLLTASIGRPELSTLRLYREKGGADGN